MPTAKEIYGSIAVLLTVIGFALYIIWATARDGWLEVVGWTWYPARYAHPTLVAPRNVKF